MERGIRCRNVQAWRMLTLLVVLSSSFTRVAPLSFKVMKEECVYEYVFHGGDTVSGNFVASFSRSGHSGIDFTVTAPGAHGVLTLNGTSYDKFEFMAQKAGAYKFCFHTSHPVTVFFHIHVHIPTEQDIGRDVHLEPVAMKIISLHWALESVKSEQIFLKAREASNRHTNESTEKRVIFYTVGEYILLALVSLLVLVSALQVVYIRRLFSKSVGYTQT